MLTKLRLTKVRLTNVRLTKVLFTKVRLTEVRLGELLLGALYVAFDPGSEGRWQYTTEKQEIEQIKFTKDVFDLNYLVNYQNIYLRMRTTLKVEFKVYRLL